MNFATRLRELREEKQISHQKLANETGISSSALARWELNQAEPTVTPIIKLAKYFGVTTDYILGISEY